ncbi:MAG TPA: hypothetical protein VJ835_11975 [Fimbriimonadaceae bacterium]|nr:hypothetical protein [Fimbriimonadaceae bacterium]
MIDLARTGDPQARELLLKHPRVATVEQDDLSGIRFEVGSWKRSVSAGRPDLPICGLVELMDNNPMVCADEVSVPDPVSTLALIGAGPLAWSGVVLEAPTVISSIPGDSDLVSAFLATAGWNGGVTLHTESKDLGGVAAATIMVAIATPGDLSEIDDIFEERYGRSFFVRRDESSEWSPDLVKGKSFALYRLRITPGEEVSLLSIQVIADLKGKCGAAQLVHAMNVMAGFEESLGLN